RRATGGTITLHDDDITHASARQRHRKGIAHIPEDRRRSGMVSEFTVAENMVLDSYYEPAYSSGLSMRWREVHTASARIVAAFDVRPVSVSTRAGHLSCGNQQKMVVARELSRDIRLIIASQTTRGVGVGSIEYIHRRIIDERDAGVGVLIVSTELEE